MARLERSQVQENLSLLGKHPISNKHIFTKLDVKGQNVSAIDILEEFPFLQVHSPRHQRTHALNTLP
ncbi:unnamed protein product [Aphanomyces euteiches]